MKGKREWFFPDAEIPPMGNDPDVYGHESIIILNMNAEPARIEATLYFTDRAPIMGVLIEVEPKRVRCVRITARDGFLGTPIPEGEQYALALTSDVPVVMQYGRLDVRQSNMAFYTTPGYCE